MHSLKKLLNIVVQSEASDLHLTVGLPPVMRKNGILLRIGDKNILPQETRLFSKEILGDNFDEYLKEGEFDIAYSIFDLGRFRVNIFKQRDTDAMAIRIIPSMIQKLESLNNCEEIKKLLKKKKGLILVTGPTGSGKSTTLAAMINEMNNNMNAHIITLEDPIEYLHQHNKCIINQREIGRDSKNYERALRAALREDPDVILLGEMRDYETVSVAITAAETGHLVFSTLHTIGATKTIDRIIDVFPPYQQQQIRIQLAAVLEGVISQQLLPSIDNMSRVVAAETMIMTSAIRTLIRDSKTYQIDSIIQTGSKYGMKTMDLSIVDLLKKDIITKEVALDYCMDKELINKLIW